MRGTAVVAVVAFHFGVPGAAGGYLGVDVFFVLSGFLITALLLGERARTGGIDLSRFWARRARRLLPGLVTMLVGVALWGVVVGLPSPATVRGDVLATLGYVANWRFIAAHTGYFAQYGPPSPMLHTWSLAIEEQFYLLWPLVLIPVARRWGARGVRDIAAAGALLSAAVCVTLAVRGADAARLYYGTDTRAQAILIGAALAAALAAAKEAARSRIPPPELPALTDVLPPSSPRRWLGALPVAGALGVVWSWHALSGTTAFLYRGGFTVVAVAAAAVVAGVVARPDAPLARALSWRPLRGIGHISYELYLWHWPVLLAVTRGRTGWQGASLLAARIAATSVLAIGTWVLVDRPVRDRWAAVGRPAARVAVPAVAVAAVTLAVLVVGTGLSPAAGTRARAGAHLAAAALLPASPATMMPPDTAVRSSGSRQEAASGGPVRAVLLGDSVALTLGDGLLDRQASFGVSLVDGGLLGCGVLGTGTVRVQGTAAPAVPGCRNWETGWRALVAQVHPDVVAVLVGRWEVVDREVGGRWSHIGDPSFDALVASELDLAIAAASSTGAKVVLLTAPHFAGLERPDGGRWPEDDPARVDRFNALLGEAAARHPGQAVLFDLAATAEPAGRYTATLDGVAVRRPDGVHFTQAGADLLAPPVLTELVRVATSGQ